MTKSILISIRPEHAVNILNGKKTLELRKSVPKDFKGWVYIYVNKGNHYLIRPYEYYTLADKNYFTKDELKDFKTHNQKIVAKFWFDEYDRYYYNEFQGDYRLINNFNNGVFVNAVIDYDNLCLTENQVNDYGNGKILYTWYIKKLEIFKNPIHLYNFVANYTTPTPLKQPPQSYQFVYYNE